MQKFIHLTLKNWNEIKDRGILVELDQIDSLDPPVLSCPTCVSDTEPAVDLGGLYRSVQYHLPTCPVNILADGTFRENHEKAGRTRRSYGAVYVDRQIDYLCTQRTRMRVQSWTECALQNVRYRMNSALVMPTKFRLTTWLSPDSRDTQVPKSLLHVLSRFHVFVRIRVALFVCD